MLKQCNKYTLHGPTLTVCKTYHIDDPLHLDYVRPLVSCSSFRSLVASSTFRLDAIYAYLLIISLL